MVMVSGMITSRTSFSLGSVSRWPAMRWTRRRNEATERSRTSSALRAVTTVRRPRRFSPVTFAGLGAGAGRMTPPRRVVRGASSSSASRTGRAAGRAAAAVSSPKRFLASSSALRLVSSSWRRRSSSPRLRASAASRSVRSEASRARRTWASSSAILRSSASRKRASASACTRAFCSSSVSVRSTTPDGFGGVAAGDWAGTVAGAAACGTTAGRAVADRCLALAASMAGGGGSALTGPPTRRFTFSTTTALVRPWLKLWRTTPCSTPRGLRVKVLVGATLSVLSPGFFVVSTILFLLFGLRFAIALRYAIDTVRLSRTAVSETAQALVAHQEHLAFAAGKECCMYHIWPPQSQIQLRRRERLDDGDLRQVGLEPPAQQRIELAHPVGRRIGRVDQSHHPLARQRRVHLGEAERDPVGLVGH